LNNSCKRVAEGRKTEITKFWRNNRGRETGTLILRGERERGELSVEIEINGPGEEFGDWRKKRAM